MTPRQLFEHAKAWGDPVRPSRFEDAVWTSIGTHYWNLVSPTRGQLANVCLDTEGGVTYWQARHWIHDLTNDEGPDVCVWSRKREVAFRTAEALVRKALKKAPG